MVTETLLGLLPVIEDRKKDIKVKKLQGN